MDTASSPVTRAQGVRLQRSNVGVWLAQLSAAESTPARGRPTIVIAMAGLAARITGSPLFWIS